MGMKLDDPAAGVPSEGCRHFRARLPTAPLPGGFGGPAPKDAITFS